MRCGRRNDLFAVNRNDGVDPDHYREDGCCSYCGSLNPDTLIKRMEAGDVELGPTDKNYKLYVKNAGGEAFKQTYRDCPAERSCTGPDDCTHWVTRDMDEAKFYFQHFNAEQRARFIELVNEKKAPIGYPGHFYVLPYFTRIADPA